MSNAEKTTTQTRPMGMGGGRMGGGRMGGGRGFTGEKAEHFGATLKTFVGYMRRYWLAIGLVIVLAVASTVFTVVGPKLLGDMTNQVVNGYTDTKIYDQVTARLPKGVAIPPGTTGAELLTKLPPSEVAKIPAAELSVIKNLNVSQKPGIDYTKIRQLAMLLIILYLLSALFSFGQGYVMSGVTQRVTYRFRKDI